MKFGANIDPKKNKNKGIERLNGNIQPWVMEDLKKQKIE